MSAQVEVAEVLYGYVHSYLSRYSAALEHSVIIDDLIAYNSCRNQHCPKCQAPKQAGWLDQQSQNLLNVPYFHIVFTLPRQISPLALQNKRRFYGLLFRCASGLLLTTAADPSHLGAKIGFTAILHTWGQTLMHHPHVHCLVPAGFVRKTLPNAGVSCRRLSARPCKVNLPVNPPHGGMAGLPVPNASIRPQL